jgi:hypothetical protein
VLIRRREPATEDEVEQAVGIDPTWINAFRIERLGFMLILRRLL